MALEKLGALLITLTATTSYNAGLKDRAMQGREGDLNEARKPRRHGTKTEEIPEQ